jgi:hypothetical protein
VGSLCRGDRPSQARGDINDIGDHGPTPDGEHIRSEQLSMEDDPTKQLALGLSVGSLDLRGVESSVTTEELSIVSGAGTVSRIGSEGP